MRVPHILAILASATVQGLMAAEPPAWWAETTAPALSFEDSNNLGVANIAQAKWMAIRALGKLQTIDPVAATEIHSRLTTPQPKPGGGTYPAILTFANQSGSVGNWASLQRSPLVLGQLKAIVKPFYDVLNAKDATWLSSQLTQNGTKDTVTTTNFYPWSAVTTDDANRAPATIGQLKAVLSLRFDALTATPGAGAQDGDSDGLTNLQEYNNGTNPWRSDTDGDGLSDKWEVDNGLSPISAVGKNGADGDLDGDGLTNGEEILGGTNPAMMDTDGDGLPDGEDPHPLVPEVSIAEPTAFRVLSVLE